MLEGGHLLLLRGGGSLGPLASLGLARDGLLRAFTLSLGGVRRGGRLLAPFAHLVRSLERPVAIKRSLLLGVSTRPRLNRRGGGLDRGTLQIHGGVLSRLRALHRGVSRALFMEENFGGSHRARLGLGAFPSNLLRLSLGGGGDASGALASDGGGETRGPAFLLSLAALLGGGVSLGACGGDGRVHRLFGASPRLFKLGIRDLSSALQLSLGGDLRDFEADSRAVPRHGEFLRARSVHGIQRVPSLGVCRERVELGFGLA